MLSEKDELVKGGGARTTLQDFVQNAKDSIKRARAELRRKGSSYGLERVSFEVKIVPGPAGEGLFFPQREDLTGGEGERAGSSRPTSARSTWSSPRTSRARSRRSRTPRCRR